MSVEWAQGFNRPGWRQHDHLWKTIRKLVHKIERIAPIKELAEKRAIETVPGVFIPVSQLQLWKCDADLHAMSRSDNGCRLPSLEEAGTTSQKGEKGIQILAPMIYKKKKKEGDESSDAETKEVTSDGKRDAGFRAVSVFDVSQTDGEELPTIRGYSGDPAENLDILKSFVAEKGRGALGVSQEGRILVKPDMEPAETFAVLAHEVAHELLHKEDRRKETTKTIRETEAEAVAYAVCSAVGLETGT